VKDLKIIEVETGAAEDAFIPDLVIANFVL
jgi:hypothetical protein